MVRLVFRPYTQVRRSICTLESLRTSTRVSPGFALLRHSSPSFGSQHVCSHSNLSPEGSWSVDSALAFLPKPKGLYFHSALGGSPRALAHMLDSLVRVSRRDVKKHFVRVNCPHDSKPVPEPGPELFPRRQESLTCLNARRIQQVEHINTPRPTLLPNGSISAISGTFHSLFKVLFIFPSRYLFAIGLPPIFSFRWNLPPT